MLLSLSERFSILELIPREGDFLTLKVVRELREKLSPSDEETENLKITVNGNQINWDTTKDTGVEFDFTKRETELITSALKECNQRKQLKEYYFSIYEKFVGED
jgi:hypothetical protein